MGIKGLNTEASEHSDYNCICFTTDH